MLPIITRIRRSTVLKQGFYEPPEAGGPHVTAFYIVLVPVMSILLLLEVDFHDG